MEDADNESWIVARGAEVVQKKAKVGESGLSDWERLVYCVWVADYMMRNAGDFANAVDMYPKFQTDAAAFAKRLGLAGVEEAFSLPRKKLQKQYFNRFEQSCDEIKRIDPQGA